jgi:hypothetical protein
VTQRVASSWRYPGPHRGDPTSSSFVFESRPGGFLHAPPCRVASSHPGSPDRNYPRMTYETTWPGFAPGASAPVWSNGATLACASSHPRRVTQTPLRAGLGIGWANSRTQEPCQLGKYQSVQPLWVIETTEYKVRVHAAHSIDNPDGSRGFISHQLKPKEYIWNLAFA